MSLASTVSSVIDVPATHSSGVELTWPAWTDAISSSVEAKIVPPFERDERLVRLGDERRGSSASDPTIATTTTPPTAGARQRAAAATISARPSAERRR